MTEDPRPNERLKPVYGPADVPVDAAGQALGAPGTFPYTRGIHPSMYRGRLWTMRQYAGFGSAAETNKRYRFLLDQGQTGLSVAFDLPTQMGHDPDSAIAFGEVGKVGVSIASVEDMADLFEFLIGTGLRKGEALGLHWDDVHLTERVLYVRCTLSAIDNNQLVITAPKTRSSKNWVAISPRIASALRRRARSTDRSLPTRLRSIAQAPRLVTATRAKIGRASCRERVFITV